MANKILKLRSCPAQRAFLGSIFFIFCLIGTPSLSIEGYGPTSSEIWQNYRGRCSLLLKTIADKVTFRGYRYTGYNDSPKYETYLPAWTPEHFKEVLKEGLYSKAVLSLAQRENIPPTVAYERLSYLEQAPKAIKIALQFLNTEPDTAWVSPFVSTASSARTAAQYGPYPGSLPVDLLGSAFWAESRGRNSVLFVTKSPKSVEVRPTFWTSSKEEETQLRNLKTIVGWTESEYQNRKTNGLDKESIELREWLSSHQWLEDLTCGSEMSKNKDPRFRLDDLLFSASINFHTRRENNFMLGERLRFLRVPPEEIHRATLYGPNKEILDDYTSP